METELEFLQEMNKSMKETQEFLVWLDETLEEDRGEGHGHFITEDISKVTDRIKLLLDAKQKHGE